jgi:flavin-binding protein dodecin
MAAYDARGARSSTTPDARPSTNGDQVAVLNSIELEGVSADSWKGAAQEALREASKTLRAIQRMDILGTSAVVGRDGSVEYRTRVRLLFDVTR